MSAVIAMSLPVLACACGHERVFPIDKCGIPPIGMESMCVKCGTVWHLLRVEESYLDTVKPSWTWADYVPPKDPGERLKTPVAYEAAVKKLLDIDAELMLGLAILNVAGRPEGTA